MPDTARAIELAGYAHMREQPGHAVTLDFTPRRTPSIMELVP